jgi:uncharacterized protein
MRHRVAPATVRRTIVASLALAVALATAALWLPAPDAQALRADRVRVLFLGDNGLHRPFARAKELLPVLAQRGVDLFYTDDPEELTAERLADYHVLLLYNNHARVSDAQLHALLQFVENGGGLVAVHSASASFQNSEAFIKLVGAAFKSHGAGTFRTSRVAANHPAIAGVPEFESWDETYVHTKHNPVDRTVLDVRREGDHEEPWTWVRTHVNGRVFYTAWGHDERTWTNEGFQQLLWQGIRWSAGDWALQARTGEPLPPTSELAVPLPVYRPPPAPWNTLDEPRRRAQVALSPEESLRLATLRPGFRVEVFATEPMIGRLIDFTWDARGRMWAVETNDYPNRVLPEGQPGGDRVLILEDTNGDGRADNVSVFAEGLNLATSLVLVNGGVVVAQAPQMLFLKDTSGDGRADERTVLSDGWPRNDTHGTPSNLRYGLDNEVLGSVGYNGFRGTVGGKTWARGEFAAGYFRFPADGSRLEYLARTSNNTWGVAQSEDGFIFGSTANNRPSTFVHIPARYYHALGEREPTLPGIEDRADIYPLKEVLQVDQFGLYTSGAAHELYTARALPREYWNRKAFVVDPTGHLVGMFDLRRQGSAFRAINQWNFMASRDAWVAPVQVKVGPDGALWVSDFYTLVSQHNPTPNYKDGSCCPHGEGNAYETPNRDASRARIYRISHVDAGAYTPLRLDAATPRELVAALRHDNMFWRLTAQRLLVERRQLDVVPDLVALARDHTIDALGLNPGALHALWTLHGLRTLETDDRARQAARDALHHPAASLRRAALMVLPRTPQLLDDILRAGMLPERAAPGQMEYTVPSAVLQDADPGVRLEALLVLSEMSASPRAGAAIAEALRVPINARDAWMPDAIGIAGARQGPAFLQELLKQDIVAPAAPDKEVVAGVARAVRRMARYHATSADAAVAVALLDTVPRVHPVVADGLLQGMADGWPDAQSPALTPAQQQSLAGVAATSPGLAKQFTRLAERWAMPGAFTESPTK